jgi:hypothetical protein
MAITKFRKSLLVACAGLLFIALAAAPSLGQQSGDAPVELSGIIIEYAVLDSTGGIVWETPAPDKPNVIPADAQRLRFRATVTNRQPGARVRLRAVLQEVCPSPDAGKSFLSKLRHLTETDHGNQTPDPADDEEQVVQADGTVSVELLVHCPACAESVCNKRCSDHRDHLGEGPDVIDLTATDSAPAARESSPQAPRQSDSTSTAPSSIRVDLRSVCTAPKKQRGGATHRGRAPAAASPQTRAHPSSLP